MFIKEIFKIFGTEADWLRTLVSVSYYMDCWPTFKRCSFSFQSSKRRPQIIALTRLFRQLMSQENLTKRMNIFYRKSKYVIQFNLFVNIFLLLTYLLNKLFIILRHMYLIVNTAQKMKFCIKVFFSKCDQIRNLLRIWSHILKKSLMKNIIFCAVHSTSRP